MYLTKDFWTYSKGIIRYNKTHFRNGSDLIVIQDRYNVAQKSQNFRTEPNLNTIRTILTHFLIFRFILYKRLRGWWIHQQPITNVVAEKSNWTRIPISQWTSVGFLKVYSYFISFQIRNLSKVPLHLQNKSIDPLFCGSYSYKWAIYDSFCFTKSSFLFVWAINHS